MTTKTIILSIVFMGTAFILSGLFKRALFKAREAYDFCKDAIRKGLTS